MKRQWILCEFWYEGKNGAHHKRGEKHGYLDEFVGDLVNGNVFALNRRKLAGLNGISVLETDEGKYAFQAGGYNGNVGMYGYLINADGSLDRFC